MDIELLYIGILMGVSFTQGYITLNLRQKKKPYLMAFSCLMFWQTAVLVCDTLAALFYTDENANDIITAFDYLVLPMCYFEVLCLTYQDVNRFSWRRRWAQTAVMTLPLVGYLIYVMIYKERQSLTVLCTIIAYMVGIFGLMVYHLYRFRKQLEKIDKEKRKADQDIKWVLSIIALIGLQYAVYTVYDYLPYQIMYYAVTYLQVFLHGHFIRKMVPTNINKLKVMNAELLEQQQEAIEELKDATEDLKHRIDIETALKMFRVEHPSFDIRIRELTDAKLTNRDILLCVLIYEGKRIPEIAEFLSISPSSVEVARHRLRTKLNLERGTNMSKVLKKVIDGESEK